MSLYVLDTGPQRVIRGSLVTGAVANTAAPVWSELSNTQGANNPLMFKGGAASPIVVAVQGVFVATVSILLAANDALPTGAVGGFPVLVTATNAPDYGYLVAPWRWLGYSISGYVSGSIDIYVYGGLNG